MVRDSAHLFKTKRFLPLFITQFFGAFNNNAFKNAFLIWFTYDVTVSKDMDAPMMVTLASALFILPFFLFSATAGQVADKYEKSSLTRKIKFAEVLLMVLCALCFFQQSIYGLLFVLFLMGTQATFFGPIKYSLLPEHLKEDELISGNGLIEGGTFLAILLGTIFGGLIILTKHGVELLSFFVIGFATIGWLSSRYIPKTVVADANLKIGWNLAAETWKIIGFAREERTVWLSIIGISWFWLIGATFLSQLPTYTKGVIGGNEHIVTLFLTTFSIGIGVGSVLCNRLLKGQINACLVPYGSIGMTLAILFFLGASYFYRIQHPVNETAIIGLLEFLAVGLSSWLVVIGLLMLAISAGVYIVPLYTLMQHRSDSRYLARIIASNNVLNALFMVVSSIAIIGLFALELSVLQVFLTVAVINVPMFFIVRRIGKK